MCLAETLCRGTRRNGMPQLGEPEIQNLQPSIARNSQVTWLQIAMNHSVLMRRRQALRELHAQTENFLLRQRSGSHLFAECDSGDVLHHQEIHTLPRVEVVDGGDVGMVELREDQSFFVEMLAGGFVDQRTGRKDFDGNIAGEMLIAGAIDLSHTTGADLLDDAVVAQFETNA